MTRPSLNRRLVLWLVAGIALIWLMASAWMAWRTLHEVDEIFDQTLVRTAASVFAAAEMPTSNPSSRASRRVITSASLSSMRITSS